MLILVVGQAGGFKSLSQGIWGTGALCAEGWAGDGCQGLSPLQPSQSGDTRYLLSACVPPSRAPIQASPQLLPGWCCTRSPLHLVALHPIILCPGCNCTPSRLPGWHCTPQPPTPASTAPCSPFLAGIAPRAPCPSWHCSPLQVRLRPITLCLAGTAPHSPLSPLALHPIALCQLALHPMPRLPCRSL